MATDMGKSHETKNIIWLTNWRRNAKKKKFQGIHDRFLRDHEIRIRLIEHHRDEEVWRRWDALADEDHTHHLPEQDYVYFKNKWWLHENKQGSNTIPLRNRPDFKQALSTLERLQKEAGENHMCLLTLTSTNNGSWHRVHLLHGGIGKIPGGLLTIQEVKEEASKVLNERRDPL